MIFKIFLYFWNCSSCYVFILIYIHGIPGSGQEQSKHVFFSVRQWFLPLYSQRRGHFQMSLVVSNSLGLATDKPKCI